jgi:hypothetical protein
MKSKSILIYGAETCLIKRKHRHEMLATETDYLRRSARMLRMHRIGNEAIRTKLGNEEGHIAANRRTAIEIVRSRHANGRLRNCWTGCTVGSRGVTDSHFDFIKSQVQ